MSTFRIKRVYDSPSAEDGCRVLVDRLWPRGLSKERAAIDHWLREIAPSDKLRKWYQHDAAKWDEFCRRYFGELDRHESVVKKLMALGSSGTVTLLYASRECEFNNAAALRGYLLEKMDQGDG